MAKDAKLPQEQINKLTGYINKYGPAEGTRHIANKGAMYAKRLGERWDEVFDPKTQYQQTVE